MFYYLEQGWYTVLPKWLILSSSKRSDNTICIWCKWWHSIGSPIRNTLGTVNNLHRKQDKTCFPYLDFKESNHLFHWMQMKLSSVKSGQWVNVIAMATLCQLEETPTLHEKHLDSRAITPNWSFVRKICRATYVKWVLDYWPYWTIKKEVVIYSMPISHTHLISALHFFSYL